MRPTTKSALAAIFKKDRELGMKNVIFPDSMGTRFEEWLERVTRETKDIRERDEEEYVLIPYTKKKYKRKKPKGVECGKCGARFDSDTMKMPFVSCPEYDCPVGFGPKETLRVCA